MPKIFELVTRNLVAMTLHDVPGNTTNERRVMGEKFLKGIKESWETHNMYMNMVADALMYLDRGYDRDHKRPSIYTSTIGLYRDHILRQAPPTTISDEGSSGEVVFSIFNCVILDHINMERDGDIIDRNLVRNCVSMLEVLYETDEEKEDEKLYLTSFEPVFLENSREFYRRECQKLLRDGDARVWLRHTRRRLQEEQDRCGTTISQITQVKLIKIVEEELIIAHLEDFIALEGSGLNLMIDSDREEDLSILYQLISRVDPSKNVLRSTLQRRVIELGVEIEEVLKNTDFSAATALDGAEGGNEGGPKQLSPTGQQTAAAIKWVSDILELKEKFDNLWRKCFGADLVIQTGLTSSFTELFRMCSRSSEYVSLFVDDNFKRGLRGKSDVEIDAALDKATTMIRHLTDKDMFERYYQKHLARRLLHNKSENPEAEKLMIGRMQQELGKSFTSKFEGMFKDMTTSEELTHDYQTYVKNLGDADRTSTDLGISVLMSNNWPPEVMGRSSQLDENSKSAIDCNYPPEIKRLQESFFKYYLKDRSGRVLHWVGSAGSADIKCLFPRIEGQEKGPLSRERRYELNVPTYGMVVLMLFNNLPNDGSLSLEEIEAETHIPLGELIRALASLSIPLKSRVLLKEPQTKNVKPGDKFSFNKSFASKAIRIKAPVINSISKVEVEEDRKATEEKNNQTRAHIIDAAVVRTMKYVTPNHYWPWTHGTEDADR